MKKIMIAAAIVCAAAFAQAATCYWNFQTAKGNSVYGPDLETEFSGAGYAFMLTSTVTQDYVLQEALGGTDLADITATKFAMDIDGTIALDDHSGLTTDGTGSANQKWFLAIVDDGNVYISGLVSQAETGLASGATVKFLTEDSSSTAQSGTSFGDAGWYAAAPEPTSGLLLLIGMAGIALRRRRA